MRYIKSHTNIHLAAAAAAESAALEETPKPKTPKTSKRKGKMLLASRFLYSCSNIDSYRGCFSQRHEEAEGREDAGEAQGHRGARF